MATQSELRLSEILAELCEKQGLTADSVDPEKWKQRQIEAFNNSEGKLNEIDGYNCDLCKNKGLIAKLSETGDEVHYYCRCRSTRSVLAKAKRSGIGNILSDCTFDKYIANEDWQKDLKNIAQEFCTDDSAKLFFIGGQVGAGKTHLCAAISGHYLKTGAEVKYMIWVDDAKRLKALVNEPEYQDVISVYKKADVLYIDDFLKTKKGEEPTNGDINLAIEIINNRYLDKNKITIISSEKTMSDLLKYDEATMSRIYQAAGKYKRDIEKDINKNYRVKN